MGLTPRKIVLLSAAHSESGKMMYHAIHPHFPISALILEGPVSPHFFWIKRIKKLGAFKVLGQILFGVMVLPFLKRSARSRIASIKSEYAMNETSFPTHAVHMVESINDPSTHDLLRSLNPDIVLICGTRILTTSLLNCISATFINIHAGITPRYRGVHGAYWALVEGRPDLCGVTVHQVDAGIDTGLILGQEILPLTPADNFASYPYLQLGIGLALLKTILSKPDIIPRDPLDSTSQLRTHPTLWGYLWSRWRFGVR